MPTVIGNLSKEELLRLHPEMERSLEAEILATHTYVAADMEPATRPADVVEAMKAAGEPIPAHQSRRPQAKMGVMVMIEISGGPTVYATDFNTWVDPDGPTLREAQAFRATREACRRTVRQMTLGGWAVGNFMSDEVAERVVEGMQEANVVTMRVLDVPAEAFE